MVSVVNEIFLNMIAWRISSLFKNSIRLFRIGLELVKVFMNFNVKYPALLIGLSPHSQRTHDAITTSLLRQSDVATSFWRNNDIIVACASWVTIVYCNPYIIMTEIAPPTVVSQASLSTVNFFVETLMNPQDPRKRSRHTSRPCMQ